MLPMLKKISLIIYRSRERGLEVFLMNNPENNDAWSIPEGEWRAATTEQIEQERMIELDPVQQENGATEEAYAVEGDWHDIPSLKAMLYEDAMHLKDQLEAMQMDKGAFVVVKDAVKKVLPHQYQFLKELKDILTDRNSVKDL